MRSPKGLDADTTNNVLAMALEAKQLELERARMQLGDQQSKIVETTAKLTEEVSFLHSCLWQRMRTHPHLYEAALSAMEIIDPST